MSRKPSRSAIAKKAWKTRRMNEAMEKAPPKFKPENKIIKGLREALIMTQEANAWKVSENQVGPATKLSICFDIDNSLVKLEERLSAINARINAIL